MKQIFTMFLCLGLAVALQAQSPFVVSPSTVGGESISLYGECMSPNRMYVVGTEQMSHVPAVWYTNAEGVVLIMENDSVLIDPSFWDEEGPAYWEYSLKEGSFFGVNNEGIAVGLLTGADFVSHPVMYNVNTNTFSTLYEDANDAGAAAYGITDDGSIVVGYHFDDSWTTHACIWTNNGATRTDLPTPTTAQVGFRIDYASARWISADGNTILGYVQDYNTGDWVAVAWKKVEGVYTVQPFCHDYYQTREYDANFNLVLPDNPNPYYRFEPLAISADGNWVSLVVEEAYDVDDYTIVPKDMAARYNLNTNTLEVLSTEIPYEAIEMFGIANNGTCVGRLTGEYDISSFEQETAGVIWRGNDTTLIVLYDLFPNESYVINSSSSFCTHISRDAAYVLGMDISNDGEQTVYYVRIGDPDAIAEYSVNMNMYPNPATSYMKVEVESNINAISVVNLMGQQVVTESNINGNLATVNVASLPNGMYIVRVVTEKGIATKRFMKM